MARIYVTNVPDDLYEALRDRARSNSTTVSQEVLAVLCRNVPTETELDARRAFARRLAGIRSRQARSASFPTAEDMIREDRER